MNRTAGLTACRKRTRICKAYSRLSSIKQNTEIRTVYRKGKKYTNRNLILYVLQNSLDYTRLSVSISRKNGNSVVRHRVTRLIRESYRLNELKFVRGLDVVIVARPGAKELDFFAVERALLHLAGLHRILENSGECEEKL